MPVIIKTGILKFLNAMGDWWPNTEKVFTFGGCHQILSVGNEARLDV